MTNPWRSTHANAASTAASWAAAIGRVSGLEQCPKLLGQNRGADVEPEGGAAGAPPPARRLVRIQVVVDRPPAGAAGAVELIGGEAGVVAEHLPDLVPGGADRDGQRYRPGSRISGFEQRAAGASFGATYCAPATRPARRFGASCRRKCGAHHHIIGRHSLFSVWSPDSQRPRSSRAVARRRSAISALRR